MPTECVTWRVTWCVTSRGYIKHVVFSAGNPGVANYYEEFMQVLHAKSGCRLPLWCVSHAGQVILPPEIAQKSEY